MQLEEHKLKNIIEGALMAANEPLSIERLEKLFQENELITKQHIQTAIHKLREDYQERSLELRELAGGYCFRVKSDVAEWVGRLWEEKPPKYSRAVLETLALIAYRQPITRGEIEEVRGVVVGTYIIKSLLERGWIRIVGHRDVPGKPSLYATTKDFLDYFNLQSLTELPSLNEIQDMQQLEEKFAVQLELDNLDIPTDEVGEAVSEQFYEDSLSENISKEIA